nr:hypothetical protein [Tanacetum cinerariifolium]
VNLMRGRGVHAWESPGNTGTPPQAGTRELHLHSPYGMLLHSQQKPHHLNVIVVQRLFELL